ncbi:MAG: ribosomal-processing cysteine protease Prp [Thermoflavifilum sp.]|nr:ribosomal-processing cysteine protease Prp [Thermoflavifilum sp.]MCL6513978.1 ribosomal-processing cysteine protease Prp [Alicyclobacillus sp.]
MIRVHVSQREGRITAFTVCGHAGYAHHGEDIVCAAVSALTLNAVNSCERLLGIRLACRDDGECLHCEVPMTRQDPKVQLLLASMVFGLEQTAEAYPEYVRVRVTGEKPGDDTTDRE